MLFNFMSDRQLLGLIILKGIIHYLEVGIPEGVVFISCLPLEAWDHVIVLTIISWGKKTTIRYFTEININFFL